MDNQSQRPILAPSLSGKLLTLAIAFFVMIITVGLLRIFVESVCSDERDMFIISSLLQCGLAFIFPAWLAGFLYSSSAGTYLGYSVRMNVRQLAGVIALMAICTPALDAVIGWNSELSMPDCLSGLEKTFREWEESAARTTEMILSDSSVWGLVSGVLVIGCVTGLAEETFFRGGLQKAMTSSGINRHAAVWTAAIVFSAVHFQFFGFVPRLLLGALFGYLYCYTGSIWVAASAHALNNSTVVVVAWLASRGYIADNTVFSDAVWHWSPVFYITSAVAMALFISFCWRRVFGSIK